MDKIVWYSEKRKLSELILSDYNPRTATDKDIKDLEKSLDKFSLADPIVINRDNRVIGGHLRIKILRNKYKDDGRIEVDVRVPHRQLTEQEEKELNLRLNKNLGRWDWELLANFSEDLLKEVGFESSELDKIFIPEDLEDNFDAREAYEKYKRLEFPDIRAGDLFILDKHRLLCGDATKKEDVALLMGQDKADMVFIDPPYGIAYYSPGGLDGKPLKTRDTREVKGDDLSLEEFSLLIGSSLNNLKEFSKEGCPIYVCCNYRSFSFFEQSLLKNNFHISAVIIWVKQNTTTPLGTAGDYAHKNEWVIKASKKVRRYRLSMAGRKGVNITSRKPLWRQMSGR